MSIREERERRRQLSGKGKGANLPLILGALIALAGAGVAAVLLTSSNGGSENAGAHGNGEAERPDLERAEIPPGYIEEHGRLLPPAAPSATRSSILLPDSRTATAENADRLGEWEQAPGCAGVKIFMGSSTGSLLVPDDATLERVLRSGTRRVAVHAEVELHGCDEPLDPVVERIGDLFVIALNGRTDVSDPDGPGMLWIHEQTIELGLLEPGEYAVNLNGVTRSFSVGLVA